MHMLAEDIQAGHGSLQIRQSDSKMFGVGRNLALTPGKVVFENELMQLIQYAPSTATVLKRPILIVPPWINKFYILDLTPEKSFIKWCVDQGLTVFVISWVNPDNKLAKKSFEDYMRDGPRHHRKGDRRARGQCHRLLRRGNPAGDHARLHGQQERQAHHLGHVLRRAGGFHLRRRSQGLR
jgi:polyhydroxyalkanoate synthase